MKCGKCGTPILPGDDFCRICGTKYESQPAVETLETQQTQVIEPSVSAIPSPVEELSVPNSTPIMEPSIPEVSTPVVEPTTPVMPSPVEESSVSTSTLLTILVMKTGYITTMSTTRRYVVGSIKWWVPRARTSHATTSGSA